MNKNKYGRNVPLAILSALILIGLLVTSILVSKYLFSLLVFIFLVIAIRELRGCLLDRGIILPLKTLWLISLILVLFSLWGNFLYYLLGLYLSLVILVLVALRRYKIHDNSLSSFFASCFTLMYLPLNASFLLFICQLDNYKILLFVFFSLIVACDIGGWLFGVFLGKHPLVPKLSPNKTYEGALGSIILSCIVAFIWILVIDAHPLYIILFGFFGSLIAILGDLLESYLKRGIGIKDFSNLIPGHGGVLDRVDAMLLASPYFYLIFYFLH